MRPSPEFGYHERMQNVTVVLSPDPERGGYSVSVPAAPGAMSDGDSRAEALANIRESVELWLEVATERGRGLLNETAELVAEEVATILGFREEFAWDRSIEIATITIRTPVLA